MPAEQVRALVTEDLAGTPLPDDVGDVGDDFATTHFLDEDEIAHLRARIDDEYGRDHARAVLAMLLDTLEAQSDPYVRDEVVAVLGDLLPYLLGTGRFPAVAYLTGELRRVTRTTELQPHHKAALDRMRLAVSEAEALTQLFHVLDDGSVEPSPEALGALIREMSQDAVQSVLVWIGQLRHPRAKAALVRALEVYFEEAPSVLEPMTTASDRAVVQRAVAIAGKLQNPDFAEPVSKALDHRDAGTRRLAVAALGGMGTPAALKLIARAVDDEDVEVRMAAYDAFMQRPLRSVGRRLATRLTTRDLEAMDLSERRALFAAYAVSNGPSGAATLETVLLSKGGLARRPSSQTPRLRGAGARDDREPDCAPRPRGCDEGEGPARAQRGRCGSEAGGARPVTIADSPRGAFLSALYHALRSVRRKGIATGATRAALDRFRASCDPVLDDTRRLELRIVRRTMYLNDEVLAADVENFVFHAHVLETLRGAGIGSLQLRGLPTRRDLQIVMPIVVRLSDPSDDPSRTERLKKTLRAQGIRSILIQPPVAGGADVPGGAERLAEAKRTYEESVDVSRELFDGTRMGRSANVDQVKRTVQGIVDGVLTNEASLGGLSALKDFDEYAFTHAVNVCIFCVAIGRRLGLSKAQLYDLGHAALVHDVGMSRIPHEILTKGSALTSEEREMMQRHTWLGALRIFELRDFGEVPLQSMLVAYEHHMTGDGEGYPEALRPRRPTIFSRIVAVAAAFDAATNERSYSSAVPADEVLRDFRENESLGFDPVIVKALTNLLGVYPVGSLVVLDSRELALVHAANADPAFVNRPVVRLLTDPLGGWLDPAPLIDLADTDDDGRYLRSIVRVTEPDRYGVEPARYFT